jgi:hypothetical protein
MHQHQLVSFATKYRFFDSPNRPSEPKSFTTARYAENMLSFLSPVKKIRKLTPGQKRHLQEHYRTEYEIPNFRDEDLANIDEQVEVWHRCRRDNTIFHCAEYRRINSTRLSHLARIQQLVDRNATRSSRTHPEVLEPKPFYVYIQFFCVHTFRTNTHMLMYSQYRNVTEHHGLVEDVGARNTGFQDIEVLESLCAKVPGHGGKSYFVDDQEVMEDRLLDIIRVRERNRR